MLACQPDDRKHTYCMSRENPCLAKDRVLGERAVLCRTARQTNCRARRSEAASAASATSRSDHLVGASVRFARSSQVVGYVADDVLDAIVTLWVVTLVDDGAQFLRSNSACRKPPLWSLTNFEQALTIVQAVDKEEGFRAVAVGRAHTTRPLPCPRPNPVAFLCPGLPQSYRLMVFQLLRFPH